jgi:acyl dehydratase
MSAQDRQLFFEDIKVGDPLPDVLMRLPIYRLVAAAAGTRDFNSIHHNTQAAQAIGAPDMFASTWFLLGTWERLVRDYLGPVGDIRSIRDFRMRRFNLAGSTMIVRGAVVAAHDHGDAGTVEIRVECTVEGEITIGPGIVEATVPRRSRGAV